MVKTTHRYVIKWRASDADDWQNVQLRSSRRRGLYFQDAAHALVRAATLQAQQPAIEFCVWDRVIDCAIQRPQWDSMGEWDPQTNDSGRRRYALKVQGGAGNWRLVSCNNSLLGVASRSYYYDLAHTGMRRVWELANLHPGLRFGLWDRVEKCFVKQVLYEEM